MEKLIAFFSSSEGFDTTLDILKDIIKKSELSTEECDEVVDNFLADVGIKLINDNFSNLSKIIIFLDDIIYLSSKSYVTLNSYDLINKLFDLILEYDPSVDSDIFDNFALLVKRISINNSDVLMKTIYKWLLEKIMNFENFYYSYGIGFDRYSVYKNIVCIAMNDNVFMDMFLKNKLHIRLISSLETQNKTYALHRPNLEVLSMLTQNELALSSLMENGLEDGIIKLYPLLDFEDCRSKSSITWIVNDIVKAGKGSLKTLEFLVDILSCSELQCIRDGDDRHNYPNLISRAMISLNILLNQNDEYVTYLQPFLYKIKEPILAITELKTLDSTQYGYWDNLEGDCIEIEAIELKDKLFEK